MVVVEGRLHSLLEYPREVSRGKRPSRHDVSFIGLPYLRIWKGPHLSDVTTILSAIEAGDRDAANELLPLVYQELRRLAQAQMAAENPGQTLDATALVHEAYLRLVKPISRDPGQPTAHSDEIQQGQDDSEGSRCEEICAESASLPCFANRRYFLASAAEAMRRILVENARRKGRIKHGGDRERVEMGEPPAPQRDPDLLGLDEALTRLAEEDTQAAKVVELRYFAGLSHAQVAETLGITVYQARWKWTYARAWLRDALGA